MNKLLAAIVASSFVLGSTTVIAADAAKKEELTQEQRSEMRSRADRLVKERAQTPTPVKADAQRAPKAKAPPAKKTNTVSRHGVKKTAPKA